jgi:hypothetical protein
MINPYDTTHYVRVGKTFKIWRKEDWSNLCADSLEYENVEVNLYGKTGDSVRWVERFVETTTSRDSGLFPSGKFQIFTLDHRLPIVLSNPDIHYYGFPDIDSLILEVRINDIDLHTNASAKVLLPAKIAYMKSKKYIYLFGNYPSAFALAPSGEYIDGRPSDLYQEIEFKVHYREFYHNTNAKKEVSWKTHEGFEKNVYSLSATRFFNPLKLRLVKNDSIITRRLDSIDITLYKPSRFFEEYWKIKDYWENTDEPPYTNFNHSYGMFFTFISDTWTGMQLSQEAMDSLCNGYYNKEMKFKYW